MQEATLIIATLALIPVGFFVYDRFIRLPHKVNVEHGNVGFERVISKAERRNETLALMVYDLKIINTHGSPITLKEIILRYTDGKNINECKPYSIPTGDVEGKQAIVSANTKDNIIYAWENIWDKIFSNNVVPPGGVICGSAIFILDTPIDCVHEIATVSLIVRDYYGNETVHLNQVKESWRWSLDKGFCLVDAPVKKNGDNIEWEGLSISTRKPA